ncbi:MAG: type II toxin-antitoxin system ParD family antitoxin [Verrucomicrobia bacterium]|nr:type II toxin-antitoxin system ParD family antitoxin [Verrucomicrobiota bacterium]
MKMATLNISLPGQMAAFVRAQCERDCGNISEYFRSLVREKMKHEIEADLRLLQSTRSGAEPGPSAQDVEAVLALQQQVKKDHRRARRA